MQVMRHAWNGILLCNNFEITVVHRNPMTGEWPKVGDSLLNVRTGKLEPLLPKDFIEIDDKWLLPLDRKGTPARDRIDRFMFSVAGWNACREEIKENWCHRKYTFEQYEACILANQRHYFATEARRIKRGQQ